jgi:phosphoribosyl 1,2-cyclic phosphate phosphodiesterase
MRGLNILNDDSRIYAHHFSHAANPPHEELEKLYASHGISVTFDGLRVEL